ncbi:MAG: LacI family DNA-binding transcriptional regulator [Anaerolineae bacterium]|nr:LacI family DNA-binding transcriptional regulator [Anaerolineae bacterium]
MSYQTVSLVINDKPGVSEKTRRRVLRLIKEMDYRPNRAAQMLTTHRSNTLELIVVDVLYGGHLADSTKNMAHAAKQAGYSLLVCETDTDGLGATLENAAALLVDGVIIYAPRLHIDDDELLALCKGIPMVRRDYLPRSRVAWVGFDQVYAARLATEYLITLGHRYIAAIPPIADLHNGYWRHTAWKSVLLEHQLTPGPACAGDYSIRSGYEAAHQIVDTGEPFTAVVVGTDNMALGAMRAFRERGLCIPEEVSVVGFDNTEFSMYLEPQLTTVSFEFAKQDEMAVRYLVDLITTPDMDLHQRILMPELIVRESACPPRTQARDD